MRDWVTLPPHPLASPGPDQPERRQLWIEVAIIGLVTFGLSGLRAALGLIDRLLAEAKLSDQTVALNSRAASAELIDLLLQVLQSVQLISWAALGLYLLWRSGLGPRAIGLARLRWRSDLPHGAALAAAIGIPGLAFYLAGRALDLNVTIAASALENTWWSGPVLVLKAFANGAAEEVLVVAFLISRLRRLGFDENRSLLTSALVRGSYHLYQGIGAGAGNVLMGLIFGRYWQRQNKLWPLIIAHGLIDTVAFLGYSLLRDRVGWL